MVPAIAALDLTKAGAILADMVESFLAAGTANPAYTGTYVYGRYQSCKHISQTGEIRSQLRRMPRVSGALTLPIKACDIIISLISIISCG